MTKKCFKCGVEKPLDEFYKHPQMGDGHLNKCKECTKKDVHENYDVRKSDVEYVFQERARGRDKYYRLYTGVKTPPERKKLIMERYYTKYPEKRKARSKTEPCAEMGFNNHHWSYRPEHAKDTITLEYREHMKLHRFMVYDPTEMMYRTLFGVLLDTKEKHFAYYQRVKTIEDIRILWKQSKHYPQSLTLP